MSGTGLEPPGARLGPGETARDATQRAIQEEEEKARASGSSAESTDSLNYGERERLAERG